VRPEDLDSPVGCASALDASQMTEVRRRPAAPAAARDSGYRGARDSGYRGARDLGLYAEDGSGEFLQTG
jgi:hypothetical protein